MRRPVMLTLCLLLLAGSARAQEEEQTRPDPEKRFWEARRVMLEKDDPATAAELFREVVKKDSKGARADDALYWMGRCYLRVEDREPDAVVAFNRLLRDFPESPFLDDAARELYRLGETTAIPDLLKRIAGDGTAKAKEMAARALVELGRIEGDKWLRTRDITPAPLPAPRGSDKSVGDEVKELQAEVARLRKEVEETIALLEKILAEREAVLREAAERKAPPGDDDGDD